MTYLLLRLLKDDLKEYTYAARLAGLTYGVASGMNAILVSKPFVHRRLVGAPVMAHFEALRVCRTGLLFCAHLDCAKCFEPCMTNQKDY